MIYRVLESQGTVQRHTVKTIYKVESFIETSFKGFIYALLLSLSPWSTESDKTFLKTKTRTELLQ